MKTHAVRIVVIVLALAVCLTPAAWAAETSNGDSSAADIGLGMASFLCSVPYGATKMAMAIVGGVVGGFAYVLSGFDKKTAQSVWYTSLGGDYVVTPDHLRGKKSLHFTGTPPENAKDGG